MPNNTNLSRTEWEKAIDEWIFSETDRAMLKRRLLDGIVYEQIAEEFNLSTVQAKSRIYRAQDRLFKHI